MDACPHHYAVRLYAGKLEIHDAKTISGKTFKLLNLPYFLGAKLEAYISWFVGEME
jgi:hypothetical protein